MPCSYEDESPASCDATHITLRRTGDKMPLLGYGTFLATPGVVQIAVLAAIESGYRHLDCAAVYGNESEVGEAVRSSIDKERVTRKDLFITSKLPSSRGCMRPENVRAACKKTIADIGCEYLDLYLLHQPVPSEGDFPDAIPIRGGGFGVQDTWREMEKLVDDGLVRNIGVSNFNAQLLNDCLCYARIPPCVNQIERHPYLTQEELVTFCHANNVRVVAYAPLGAPGLKSRGKERPSDAKPDGHGRTPLLEHPVVNAIAKRRNVSPANVLSRFHIDRGIACIPKSTKPGRIVENFQATTFVLQKEDIDELSALNEGFRVFKQDWAKVPSFA